MSDRWRSLPVLRRTIPDVLQAQSQLGQKPCVRVGATTLSYADMLDVAAETAGTLRSLGIASADRVAVMSANRLECFELFLGCAWMGAVAVPLNTELRGAQLEHALTDSGSRGLVIEAELIERLAEIDRPSTLGLVWALDQTPPPPPGAPELLPWPGRGRPVPPAHVHPGDTAAVLYTSGTTGPAKGVCCPHGQFFWGAVAMNEVLGITSSDVLHSCLPLFHTNALGTFFKTLLAGATCSYARRFSARLFWSELIEADATVTFLLGTMVNILLSRPPSQVERQHRVRTALSPGTSAAATAAFFQRTGIRLVDGYGSTETGGTISAPPHSQRPGYMGRVLDDFEARVVDDDDEEVPAGTPGELVLRSHQPHSFFTGYLGLPEKTLETWRNLWLHTGDQVVCDSDGWYRFQDRNLEVIRRRGENVSAYEVEQTLTSHRAVSFAAVFGVPSPLGEEEVAAAVVVKGGETVTGPELVAHCERDLAYFAVPRYIDFVDAVPTTPTGKVRKAQLRERGITQSMWDRDSAGHDPERHCR